MTWKIISVDFPLQFVDLCGQFKIEVMYKKVVIKSFEKAKAEISGRSNKTNRSEHISNMLLENFKFSLSSRTLRNLYDDSVKKNSEEDITINSNYVNYLCLYLGFENYQDFLKEYPDNSAEPNNNSLIKNIKKNKLALIVSVMAIFIVFFVTTFNKQRWMIWEKDHYIEVSFSTDKYNLGQLKLFNEERLTNFKKIQVDCSTIFFTENGIAKVWYGKNIKKELEYFTTNGLHPETGKTLHPITEYMIKKYICEEY